MANNPTPNYTGNQALNGLNPLAYIGVNPYTPPNLFVKPIDPTSNDIQNFVLGSLWLNKISQALWYLAALGVVGGVRSATWIKISSSTGNTETLTGNSGGVVPPTANNINIVGDGTTINIVGNPATSTLTVSVSGIIADSFPANSGTGVPLAGVLNVLGTGNIATAGSGNTIDIGLTGITQHTVQIGGASNVLTQLANGTTGQVLTAQTGANPIWASVDNATSFITSPATGTATPNAGVLTFSGTGGMVPTAGTSIVSYAPPGLGCAFYVEFNEEDNVTGDSTNFYLGSVTAGTVKFDLGGNITAGGGGTPITFTAPATGYYQFNVNFQVFIASGSGNATRQSASIINSGSLGLSANAFGNIPSVNLCTGFEGENHFNAFSGSLFTSLSQGQTITILYGAGADPGGNKNASIEPTGSFSGFRVA